MAKKTERFVNGYKMILNPEHPERVKSGAMKDYVYEHRIVAEEIIGRPLRLNEDVHHLDSNRANNLPRNLLILENTQHKKLHNWLDQHIITPKENTKVQREMQLNYCQCGKQIESSSKYCSVKCNNLIKNKLDDTILEQLQKQVWLVPTSVLAIQYGVSDKGLEKHCRKYGIEKPPRGYWQKVEEGYLIAKLDF